MFDVSTGVRRVAVLTGLLAGLTGLSAPTRADGGADDAPSTKAREERDMLDRARREAPAGARRLEGTVVNVGEAQPIDAAGLETKRRAELDRLSEKIRRASQIRGVASAPVDRPWTTEVVIAPPEPIQPESRSALGKPIGLTGTIGERSGRDGLVTVLMIMKPGDRGIRRLDKTADPLLCTSDGCYISAGGDLPARFLSTARSLSIANTFGDRAGACRNQTACTFRAVDLGAAPSFVRPIDLRVVHHDRREMKRIAADATCRVTGGRLQCLEAVRAEDYTLWVVPEAVAAQAGPALLQRALETGLSAN